MVVVVCSNCESEVLHADNGSGKTFVARLHELIDSTCGQCGKLMVLERGHYVCFQCGYTPEEDSGEDDEPRTVDDLK